MSHPWRAFIQLAYEIAWVASLQEQGLRKIERSRRGVSRREVERISARENFNMACWEQIFVVRVRGGCFLSG